MDWHSAKASSIAQDETRIGLLVGAEEELVEAVIGGRAQAARVIEEPTPMPGVHQPVLPRVVSPSLPRRPPPKWTDDEPATVFDYREMPLPKDVKAPQRPAFKNVERPAPRVSILPAVSEHIHDTEPPLVLRVQSSPEQIALHKTGPRRTVDRTAPARAFADRLPGVTPPRVAASRPLSPKRRVPGPEDTILEASVIMQVGGLREELAGLLDVSPNRYIPTMVTPKLSRNVLARIDTHLMSAEPTKPVSVASVALSIAIGVLVMLMVLYQVL